MTKNRTRRTPDDARRVILAAAEELLIAYGPVGVTVRAVANQIDMTDAGINHHFGSRQGLLEALLNHGGRRLRHDMELLTAQWLADGPHLKPFVEALAAFYQQGYSGLAIALHGAGWRNRGNGLLQPVVDALHRERMRHDPSASLIDTQLTLAALHQGLAVEPTYGASFRRSAGITGRPAADSTAQIDWWTKTIGAALDLPD